MEMNPVGVEYIPLQQSRGQSLARTVHQVVLGSFLIRFALVFASCGPTPRDMHVSPWPEILLIVLATATTCVSLARRLSLQNVMSAAALIVLISGAANLLGISAEGPVHGPPLRESLMIDLFGVLPWVVPLVWIVVVLNSRGVARLILRPWRDLPTYGYWLLGLAVVLTGLSFYVWSLGTSLGASLRSRGSASGWHRGGLLNLSGEGVMALAINIVITPFLINKRPGREPADFHPLLMWGLLNFLFYLESRL